VNFLQRTNNPLIAKLLIDAVLAVFGSWAAFALRLGLPLPFIFAETLPVYVFIAGGLKILLNLHYALFRQSWRNIGLRDLTWIARSAVLFTAAASAASFFLGTPAFPLPRSIPLIDGLLLVLLWGGARVSMRLLHEGGVRSSFSRLTEGRDTRSPAKRVLIVGAGDAGLLIAREMLRHADAGLEPVGFLDDDPSKRGVTFVGWPVLGVLRDPPAPRPADALRAAATATPPRGRRQALALGAPAGGRGHLDGLPEGARGPAAQEKPGHGGGGQGQHQDPLGLGHGLVREKDQGQGQGQGGHGRKGEKKPESQGHAASPSP